MVNARAKGGEGEREIANLLNDIIAKKLRELGREVPDRPIVQRNQNQSAVGGSDLTNTFGLAIEVKRQETLTINSWWRQCVASAVRNKEEPVLIYRQNRKAWHVVMNGWIGQLDSLHGCTMTVSMEDFLSWFAVHVEKCLGQGDFTFRI